jgi:hypothetical protein
MTWRGRISRVRVRRTPLCGKIRRVEPVYTGRWVFPEGKLVRMRHCILLLGFLMIGCASTDSRPKEEFHPILIETSTQDRQFAVDGFRESVRQYLTDPAGASFVPEDDRVNTFYDPGRNVSSLTMWGNCDAHNDTGGVVRSKWSVNWDQPGDVRVNRAGWGTPHVQRYNSPSTVR